MPDNLNRRQPEDQKQINKNQDWEVAYWCKKLDCTEEKLIDAINAVGPYVKDVKHYLES